MSDDIVTRLRRAVHWLGVVPYDDDLAREAADENERLQEDAADEIEFLRALCCRAWRSYQTNLSRVEGCVGGLSEADIIKLVAMARAEKGV